MTIKWPEGRGGRRGSALAAPVIFNMLPIREAPVKSIDSCQLCLNLRFQLKHCAPVLEVGPGSPVSGVRVAWPGRGVAPPRIPEVAARVRPRRARGCTGPRRPALRRVKDRGRRGASGLTLMVCFPTAAGSLRPNLGPDGEEAKASGSRLRRSEWNRPGAETSGWGRRQGGFGSGGRAWQAAAHESAGHRLGRPEITQGILGLLPWSGARAAA